MYLQNDWTTLHVWVSNLNWSLFLWTLPTESLGYTTLIGVQPQVQPMIVRSTYRITRSHYTFGCPTYSSAYVCKLYVQNHLVTLHLWKRHLKCSLCWLPLRRESPGYLSLSALTLESLGCTTLIRFQLRVQRIILRFTYRLTGLH